MHHAEQSNQYLIIHHHGGKEGRPDYLIDHSPKMTGPHNFVITSRSTTEIEALLRGTLELHQITPDINKATRVLDSLRALSGRLALKLASNSASKSEALGLALSKLYLEYQGVFNNQIVVPLDAHLELYADLQKADAELGGEVSLKRTDLALFDLDVSSRMIRCNLVEVKCYSEVGDPGKYESLKKRIAEQISESERIIQRHFDLHRTTPDRPDRLLKTQRLCELLEHYLKRSERFSLLSPEVVDEAKFLLRTLEQGYRLAITRSAVIFDFAQSHSNIENEVGIEFHRVGRTHIEELLSFPVGDENEPTLDTLELTLPRLDSANFLFKQRERTVSWDQMLLTIPKTLNSAPIMPIAHESGSENQDIYKEVEAERKAFSEPQIFVEQPTYHNHQNQMPEKVALEKSALELARQLEYNSILTTEEDPALDIGAVANITPLDNSKAAIGITSAVVPHDIVLGVNGDSAQFGILGEASGRKVALDLNHTHTISLFGVQGGGKSYTLGSVVEMATTHIPHINQLLNPLSTVIFHSPSNIPLILAVLSISAGILGARVTSLSSKSKIAMLVCAYSMALKENR